ncbi:sugar ABC transporter permease [Clostridiales bacterium COT073_COT-073]|nr:sugar ABC transporter permease [Clostridiales bacterium COT073_COT-073]
MQKTMTISAKKTTWHDYKKHSTLFIMAMPLFLYFFIFHYGPIYGLLIAFKEYYPLKGIWASDWVGFEHFKTMFQGIYFIPVLKNTLINSLYNLIFGFPAPIILAILLNEVSNRRFKKVIQTVTYFPHFISWVVLAGIVYEMLSPSRGPINILLTMLGFEPIFFVADVKWFRTVLVGSNIWKEIGWGSIIYLAAITNIDPTLYEVAKIDGASRLQRIFYITLPGIANVVIIMLIFAVGKIINDNFDQIFNLMNNRVMEVADVISTYTYREGIKEMNYGYATAVGLFKNTISFTLVMGANWLAKKMGQETLF